uniref:Aminopeptidase n=1 Tax=Acrobeloides nanus TaxID=290746 RepID=A0A914C199_9BILA
MDLKMDVDDKFSKLPELVKPSLYTIHLKPDLTTFKCEGHETIDLEIVKETDFFKFHSSNIDVKSATLKLNDGTELKELPIELDKKWMTVTLRLPHRVAPQQAKLSIDFEFTHDDKMHGFYRSSYKTANNETKHLLSTQFESTYARMSFPCWDEPIYKARFDISMEIDRSLTALSNMNVIGEEVIGEKKLVKFATTPKMSTYLVAFAVGEFDYLEDKTKSGCTVRVYTVPGKANQAQFALEVATKCIDWYNEWFDFPSPLSKCDLIAIPDFSMGAMENWGLVTFREVALLSDPAKTSTIQKMYIAMVIAHELAHFWFGDLVTMKWWTDLWLKEGFASFMEYVFIGYNYPEFKIWNHFVRYEIASGFSLDSLRSSHPIEVEINNPNELDEIYDSITYAKSNSVNRMLCNFLGEPTFQKALRNYLKKYQYSNAETKDLWDALSAVSDHDINEMMSSWTKQMGFPLVSVSQQVDGENRILRLRQHRFIADGGEDPANQIWQIPINICTASSPSEPKFKVLFTGREKEITISGIKSDEWVKLNAGTSGFYRVQYSDDMFNALLPAIESKTMPVLDRFGIADELFALVESGKVPASNFLSLYAAAGASEDNFIVWAALDDGISNISNVITRYDDGTLKKRFNAFICKLLAPAGQRLGWVPAANEDNQVSLLRALILSRLAKAGHQPTIDAALAKFNDHFENNVDLHPDLRGMIYGVVARNTGKDGIEKLRKIFETCGFSEVERNCIVALGQASEENLLEDVFKYGVTEGKIRSQDYMSLFVGTCAQKVGQEFAWNYFKSNLKEFLKIFGTVNNTIFQRCLKIALSSHCTENVAEEAETFFKSNLTEDELTVLDRPIRQSVESIRLNSQLLKRNGAKIDSWLTEHGF